MSRSLLLTWARCRSQTTSFTTTAAAKAGWTSSFNSLRMSQNASRPFSVSTLQNKDQDKVKILFFGSDSFSVPHLEALIQEKSKPGSIIERIDVVSPKERTKKSKRDAEDSPLTLLAKAHNLNTYPSPDRKGGFGAWTFPEDSQVDAWDFGVVVSFGWFLPDDVITRFKKAGINVHPSLLPKYRGSAPLQRAILNQDQTTGVTVQLLDPNEFDAGKILAQAEVALPENSTYRSLEALLAKKGGELVVDVINNYDQRRRDAKTQDPTKVTKANKISREACKVQWSTWTAARTERLHRANGFRYPITSTWTVQDSGKALPISLFDLFRVDSSTSTTPTSTTLPKNGGYAADGKTPSQSSAPGTIFYHGPTESLHITCSDGSLLGVKAVQFEGKKRLSAKDFHNGYHVHSGSSRFE
ncbi:formyl transferase [Linnemannia elongata]|nr:formyl transferase [Linnemannia elongata]